MKNQPTLEEIRLAQFSADILNKHYPGNLWAVSVNTDAQNAILTIKALNISHAYGYLIHLKNATMYANTKALVIKAGGEILERAGFKRGVDNNLATPKYVEGIKDSLQPIPKIGAI